MIETLPDPGLPPGSLQRRLTVFLTYIKVFHNNEGITVCYLKILPGI